ncbi:MAG: Clp protease ClpP [Alistipes sp.]|nr:Clp protease ClpP [Alistipes sp.]
MNQKINIKNEVGRTTIDIEGTIGIDEQWQFENPDCRVATYERFRECVSRIADIRNSEIRVNIRSTGGDVNDAILIYEALKATGAKVVTCCYGYTASAATIVAQAASEGCRLIAPTSLYLIHNSICATEGNAEELQSEVDMLQQTDRRIAEIYASRSRRSTKEIAALMAENGGRGRWLSPEEAVAAGLVDKIIEEETSQSLVERTKRGVMALIKGLSKDDGRPQISANHTSSSDVIHTSLRNMIERQGSVSQTQVQSIQDPDPLDSKHNPRTMAYEEDARNIRFR